MPLKPFVTRALVAGKAIDVNAPPFRYLRILSVTPATATFQIKLADPNDNGDLFTLGLNERIERPLSVDPIQKLYVQSDTSGAVVTFLISETDHLVQDVLAGGGVVVINPLNSAGQVSVGGPEPFGHVGPLTDSDNPLVISALQDAGGGNERTVPFVVYNEGIATEPAASFPLGFVATAPITFSCKGYATARIQIQAAGAGGNLFALDDFGNILPIYDADTAANVGIAGIAAANTTGFYIPLAGVRNLTLASAGAPWGFWGAFSAVPFTPVKP
jgi:hypothetical protein